MKTQIDKIKEATRAYIIQLSRSSTGMTRRYCVYLQPKDGSELDVLWPSDSDKGAKADLLPAQVYSKRGNDSVPAFHFRFGGCGFSAADELRKTLLEVNPSLDVMRIAPGWSPGASMM